MSARPRFHAASMLLPTIPEAYDVEGRPITRLSKRHHLRSTYPLDRYLTQPLGVRCGSLAELPGLAAEVARFHAEALVRAAAGAGKAALALLRLFT